MDNGHGHVTSGRTISRNGATAAICSLVISGLVEGEIQESTALHETIRDVLTRIVLPDSIPDTTIAVVVYNVSW